MKDGAAAALGESRQALAGADGFDADSVEAALSPLPDRLGLGAGKVYQPIRVAITGCSVSPGIFESLAALGREESLARIDAALERLGRVGGRIRSARQAGKRRSPRPRAKPRGFCCR